MNDNNAQKKVTEIVANAQGHISSGPGGVSIGSAAVPLYRLLSMRSGLSLELKGMRISRGISCYALAKKEFGLKGNKQKVYDQLCAMIEQAEREVGVKP